MTDIKVLTAYPKIQTALLAIVYDNGGIYRERSQEQMLAEANEWLSKQTKYDYHSINEWLSTRDDGEIEMICTDSEAYAETHGPIDPLVDDFLNDYFDEVC